ncbi:PaiB family negative transcriptional regulator [Acinetobacter calcoaceticus]|uniref:PaiB family negative transcriptional regulator n=1 Tax=Acinetobacter calcoaceticus TaxID=471 RepID=A0A4R1Y2W6_ACICA|nr:PaiB family negative transcriptional regulator [Acinetobacter calcoaceticus]
MFLPACFEETDPVVLQDLIQHFPLGTLITQADGLLQANHLPFEFEVGEDVRCLKAHIARANPLLTHLHSGAEVLVVFQAEQAYISPNWYTAKAQHHREVPTWNYRVVHVRGKIQWIEDERFLRGLLARLTRQHESTQAIPWKMSDAPADYIAENLKHIMGIEIQIESMIGNFKLSQNKTNVDRHQVATQLDQLGHHQMAEQVRLCIEQE